MCIQIRSVRAPACRSVASPVVNGVLESRTMRLRIVGSCRGYGKFPEISPPEQAWHISQNISGNVGLPQGGVFLEGYPTLEAMCGLPL